MLDEDSSEVLGVFQMLSQTWTESGDEVVPGESPSEEGRLLASLFPDVWPDSARGGETGRRSTGSGVLQAPPVRAG